MSKDDVFEELRSSFRDETAEALDAMLRLRDGWASISDAVASERVLDAFRIFHNLKGAARLVGLEAIEPLAHAAEELLRHHHDARERPAAHLVDRLANVIMTMLRHAEGEIEDGVLHALADELSWEAETASGGLAGRGVEATLLGGAAARHVGDGGVSDASLDAQPSPDVHGPRASDTVRVRVVHLDRLIAMTAELLTHHAQLGVREARLEGIADAVRDALRGVSGEAREAMVRVLTDVDGLLASDRGDRQRLGLLARELGETVRSARMLHIAGAVAGFRRIAEDAANDLGKHIRFEADVGEIALDRRTLEGLRDPMMHLLRNAVDHGIEAAAERAIKGKPEVGTLTLSARAIGPNVEITLTDDGRGIDRDAVVARAVDAGIVTAERALGLDAASVTDLVFAPGLSTAKAVTRLSGRGIGLDVVRSRLRDLGGTITIHSDRAVGSTFRLLLPVDVVQTSGLLVRVGTSVLAIPMTQVMRTQRIPTARVKRADGATIAVQADDEPLRLLWLASLLGLPRESDADSLMVVAVEHGGVTVGLVVAEVLGEAEFVVRPLPWNIEHVAGVIGAAVLGDGCLAIVLHVAQLLCTGTTQSDVTHHTLRVESSRTGRSVLVVDDSVTSRILVRNILDAAGYETIVANDGEEAWDVLQRRQVDLVVTDVQMPRLDGHGLTKRIRRDPKTADIPIIMVTSLSRPEDVALGSEAGADEYIVKGRFDHRTLLEAVARLS